MLNSKLHSLVTTCCAVLLTGYSWAGAPCDVSTNNYECGECPSGSFGLTTNPTKYCIGEYDIVVNDNSSDTDIKKSDGQGYADDMADHEWTPSGGASFDEPTMKWKMPTAPAANAGLKMKYKDLGTLIKDKELVGGVVKDEWFASVGREVVCPDGLSRTSINNTIQGGVGGYAFGRQYEVRYRMTVGGRVIDKLHVQIPWDELPHVPAAGCFQPNHSGDFFDPADGAQATDFIWLGSDVAQPACIAPDIVDQYTQRITVCGNVVGTYTVTWTGAGAGPPYTDWTMGVAP